jgi:hypothetical protein
MGYLKMIEIIYSSKNFVVLKHKKYYYCYSYCKQICLYSIDTNVFHVFDDKIETQKNKCHLKQFKEIVEELKENNTL